jgi:hypothetical protein
VRGEGGYVILPPSRMLDGKVYAWEVPLPHFRALIPPAPARLLDLVVKRGEFDPAAAPQPRETAPARPRRTPDEDPVRRYALAALESEAGELAGAVKGTRGSTLNTSAFKLGQLVGAGALSRDEAHDALWHAADSCGLTATDGVRRVEDTITRAIEDGAAQPRDLADVRRQARSWAAGSACLMARAEAPAEPDGSGDGAKPPAAAEGANEPKPRRPRRGGFSMEEMNRQFALVLMGSKAVILHEQDTGPVEDRVKMIGLDGFRAWFFNRFTEVADQDGKIKTVTWADAWLRNSNRRQYKGIEFHPDPVGSSGTAGYFNLWRGFTAEPKPKANGYSIFQDHLLNNVCNGDAKLYAWVFGWFAHIMQRPRERLGTALVCRGKMGTGKTKIGEVFGDLIASHYFLVDDPRYLVG